VTTGAWVLLATVSAAAALGLWRAWSDGRFRGTHQVRGQVRSRVRGEVPGGLDHAPDPAPGVESNLLAGTPYAAALGERATLLQFSSAFCAPCRATRQTLAFVAGQLPGVAHVEVDAEQHLDLVRRLGVQRTPTTLVLDARGRETTRAAGAPRREQVLAALEAVPGLG
jgi:thiol-disulfide isomerase/thioredoxin